VISPRLALYNYDFACRGTDAIPLEVDGFASGGGYVLTF